jgi:16S rRNA pseudouridine516 synthase
MIRDGATAARPPAPTASTGPAALADPGSADGRAARPLSSEPVTPTPTRVCLDGEPLDLYAAMHLLQHKPCGVVTALRDPIHETAWSSLRGEPLAAELRAVGRLDRDATGLLLWTTDGALVHALTHPKRQVPRTYHVALSSPPRSFEVRHLALADGHQVHLAGLAPLDRAEVHAGLIVPAEATCFATITLHEGRFHEVKRIFVELGVIVLGLCRVAYGAWTLPHDLAPGEHRRIALRGPA